MRKTTSGFTIVELMIVIVIIGILAAITIVSYNGIQDRARAASLVTGLQSIDEAFQLKAAKDNITTWWTDTSLTGSGNPTIDDLISNTDLKNYLQEAPTVSGLDITWRYDNDGDSYTGCDTGSRGVNIFIPGLSEHMAQVIDTQIDDGNLGCGKVHYKYDTQEFFYTISSSQSLN